MNKDEFRRYRQALQALVGGVTAILAAWLIASVAHGLFARPAAKQAATVLEPKPDEAWLLQCQADVESLFDSLHQKLFDLLDGKAPQPGAAWDEFSRGFATRRREIGQRCRFEGRNPQHGLGAAHDRLAAIYDELDGVQRSYALLLHSYLDHYAARVGEIRHALQTSRKMLEAERAARGSAPGAQ